MGRYGATKSRIIKLISNGTDNLSDISEELNLAQSTVSKHIHDLESSGVIRQKENLHVKKWKYYQLCSKPAHTDGERDILQQTHVIGSHKIIVIGLILFAAFAVASYLYMQSTSVTYIPMSLSDPPLVPEGTQSLYINYSSVAVHVSIDGALEWLPVNASGRVDLLSLINVSQVIGELGVKPNALIGGVRFNITSASIMIDNVTYPVAVSSKEITATIGGYKRVNATSGLLLDFLPIVVPAYENYSTVFAMLPSLTATIGKNPAFYGRGVPFGYAMHRPDYAIVRRLYPLGAGGNAIFYNKNTGITATNATLHINGSRISFTVALYSAADINTTIEGVILYGSMPGAQVRADNITGIIGNIPSIYNQNGSTITINSSRVYIHGGVLGSGVFAIRTGTPVNEIIISGVEPGAYYVAGRALVPPMPPYVSFAVRNNGTLTLLPSAAGFLTRWGEIGYAMKPLTSVTLSYNGIITRWGTPATLPNDTYNIVIVTNYGMANAKVTSS